MGGNFNSEYLYIEEKMKDLKQFIKTTIREFLNENVNKPYSYFFFFLNDAGADVRRNFSGHMQAWFDTEKEAMDDYNERISDGKYIPYPPKKDITNGMWNSEPEWGLSGYGFRDEETFNNSMEEINDIAWHHSENLQQDLIVFRSSNFILGDGFDGEDVFRDADKYWYIEPDMNYNDVMNIIKNGN